MSLSTQIRKNRKVEKVISSSLKQGTVHTASEPSQPSEILDEGLSFVQVSRPWPSGSAPFSCLYGLCTQFELCIHCSFQSSNSPQQTANHGSSLNTSILYPSVLQFDHSTTLRPYSDHSHHQPHPNLPEEYYSIPTPKTPSLTPVERFISETITSQPYNTMSSFIPLSTMTTKHSTPPSVTEYQRSTNGTSSSTVSYALGTYGSTEDNVCLTT